MKPLIFLAFANDRVDTARYLRNLPAELEGLRKILQPAVQAGLCEVVERANASIEQIIDVFQIYADRIAIFHYGGHADGYQLLLESASGAHQTAHGEGLVSFFARQKGLQLVFFNGCSTQQQSQELINAGIPAVIGTSNAISDEVATQLSLRFYAGLAKGASIEKAWADAMDQLQMQHGRQVRGMYRKNVSVESDTFPWQLLVRAGAEKVRSWNLPEEAENPLFGLPAIPRTHPLPESPFLFLKRYERQHAEVFFGRSFYVRDLYNKIADAQAPPVILLYGQSGTGKSSLFEAGLNPRLEQSHHVCYLRRSQPDGLVGTLRKGLSDILNRHARGSQPEAIEEPNNNDAHARRKSIVEQLRSQLLYLAESERINLSATLQTLEQELLPTATTQAVSVWNRPERERLRQYAAQSPYIDLLIQWHEAEDILRKPLVVVLDQAEELFTRPAEIFPSELNDLAECIQLVFTNPRFAPQGRLLLGYRKEYHAEFEEAFIQYAIPRSKVFLEPLSRKDVIDIFKGLSETPVLRQRYNLKVEPNLPAMIADDLLEDKESPVAPVLQILLTRMWHRTSDSPAPAFTTALYTSLKREGFLLDDFFRQQTLLLAEWNADLESSGLPLDLLYFHTTPLGTAEGRTVEEIKNRYIHVPEKAELLLYKLKELYLLVESGVQRTSLTHDTLAPLVRNEFRRSRRPGQRASRILENQLGDFIRDPRQVLDELQTSLVEDGTQGMRQRSADEEAFLQASQAARLRKQEARIRLRKYAIGAISTIFITALFSLYQWNNSLRNQHVAKMKEIILLAEQKMNSSNADDRHLGIRLAEQAVLYASESHMQERSDVYHNLRQVSERYRQRNEAGAFWLPPLHTIRHKELFTNIVQQKSTGAPNSFVKGAGTTGDLVIASGKPPEFAADLDLYGQPTLLRFFPKDSNRFIIWVSGHSFRIQPFRTHEPAYVVKADSNIVDMMPIDSLRWLLLDADQRLLIFNPYSPERDSVLHWQQADSAAIMAYFKLLKVTAQHVYGYNNEHLLRLRLDPQGITADTLFSHSDVFSATDIASQLNYHFSTDMQRGLVQHSAECAYLLFVPETNKYRAIPMPKLLNGVGEQISSVSPDMHYAASITSTTSFRVLELTPGTDKVQHKQVLKHRVLGSKAEITKVQISPDGHLLVLFSNHYRVLDFKKHLKDVFFFYTNMQSPEEVTFSPDGQHLISVFQTYTELEMPIYHLAGWIARTPAQALDISKRVDLGIASLGEQLSYRDTRTIIAAQLISFISLLLLLVRYIPVGLHLVRQGNYYKPILYGIASIFTLAAIIFKEVLFEAGESFMQQIGSFFILLSSYLLLLLLYEQREELKNLYLTKNWLRFSLLMAPEIIALAFCAFIFVDEAESAGEDILFLLLLVLIFFAFNTLNLWLVHRSEYLYKSGRYLRMAAALYIPISYLLVLLASYLDIDIVIDYLLPFMLSYFILLVSIWLLHRMWRLANRVRNKLNIASNPS